MAGIMFARKRLLSKCLFLLPSRVLWNGCRIGRGLCCVTSSCIAVAGCVRIFWGSVSITHCCFVRWKNRGRLTARLFSVFHCLISILSPAVRKTNYVFNPLPHPPPLLFRSSHLEIIMSLWQTTLALEKGREKNSEKSICLHSNRPLAITDNLLTLESCRLKFFQGLTKT